MAAQLEQCQKIIDSYNYPIQSAQALREKLHGGVLIDNNKYFWLDNQARLGVELYARALDITWGSNLQYWAYVSEKILNTDHTVEVAKLLEVCWLDVKAEFDMRMLTVGKEYEIFFDIELSRGAQGWNCRVAFENTGLSRSVSRFETGLDHLIGAGRVEILVGKFTLPSVPVDSHNATFRMYEHGKQWKHGLIVRGVFIKPAIDSKYSLHETTASVIKKGASM